MDSMFSPGSFLRFDYPSANYRGVRRRLEPRRLKVEKIRDTDLQPIEADTLLMDPMLDRGRILVTGTDLDKNAERSFYLHAMTNVEAIEAAEADLPQLPVLIEKDGQPLRIVHLDDPRESFCRHYNSFDQDSTAKPVSRSRELCV